MRRTQLQLDEQTYQLLRSEAFARGISIARLIRDLLREGLGMRMPQSRSVGDFTFVGSGRSQGGPVPISERHDEALAEDFSR